MSKRYQILSTKYSIHERQTKNYGKVYDVYFRIVDGNTIKQKNLAGFKTKTLAKQGYADFVTEYCELSKINPLRQQKKAQEGKENLTVGILSKEYFNSQQNQIKESTTYGKIKMFDLIILPEFENVLITDLTKERLLQWQDKIWAMKNPKTNDYYSYKYLSNIRINFSAFLTWCAERYGTVNYLSLIKKPKRRQPKTEMQFWTKEDFEKFISVVDNPLYHCLFTMLFYTGRRKGEILALSPGDVQKDKISFNKTYSRKVFDKPYLITSTKNEKSGFTPICPTLQKELQNYAPDKDAKFFFGGDHPIHENSVANNFKRYCKIADVKEIRIHDLRHSFVSMLIHNGANFMVVADLIGDTVEQIIKTYGHLYETDKLQILSKF